MSEETDALLTGRAGNEAAQGWTPMPMANPDREPEPAIDSDSAIAKHLERPAPPEPVERAYHDAQTGDPRDGNETVELERAAKDISEIREAERLELQKAHNSDLNQALDFLAEEEAAIRAATTPQPVQAQEPSPEVEGLQPEQLNYERANALFAEADATLQEALKDPIVRQHIEAEFNQVRVQAAAQVEAAKTGYQQATQQLALEAVATMAALVPELQEMTLDQARGALAIMAKQDPQRVAALGQLMQRSQNIIAAHQQQQFAEQQRQAQVQAQALEQFKIAEDKKWEAAVARDRSPEQIKALRENAIPLIERHYGIDRQLLGAIYSGQQRVDAATFMRSANFQLMLSDALSYRMSREAVGRAVNRPIPNVQRPGISEPVRIDDGAVSAALARLQAPGGNEGRTGLRNAAALVAARRGGRG